MFVDIIILIIETFELFSVRNSRGEWDESICSKTADFQQKW